MTTHTVPRETKWRDRAAKLVVVTGFVMLAALCFADVYATARSGGSTVQMGAATVTGLVLTCAAVIVASRNTEDTAR